MKLQAFILIVTIFKIILAKEFTFQCNISGEEQFDTCEFSRADHNCVFTTEKSPNEDCTQDYLNNFKVEQSEQGCTLTIKDLHSDLFGNWTCKLKRTENFAEYDDGEDHVERICTESIQAEALLILSQTNISTVVWIVVTCIVVIGVISFFILKKVWNQSGGYKL